MFVGWGKGPPENSTEPPKFEFRNSGSLIMDRESNGYLSRWEHATNNRIDHASLLVAIFGLPKPLHPEQSAKEIHFFWPGCFSLLGS